VMLVVARDLMCSLQRVTLSIETSARAGREGVKRSPSQPHSGERGATGGTQREDPCLARRHAYPVS